MIDDKKIETAKEEIYEDKFLGCGEMVEAFEDEDEMEMFDKEDIKEAIGLGAEWAINEFLKDLWHDPFKERIPYDKKVIIEYTYKGGMHYKSIKIPDDIQWIKGFSNERRLRCWLYVDDLFPKEGGENERI